MEGREEPQQDGGLEVTAVGGTMAKKNSWETLMDHGYCMPILKTFIMQKCKCTMLPVICTGSILHPHPIFVQISYIMHFVSLVLRWIKSQNGIQHRGDKSVTRKLRDRFKKKINVRKWSESEKPRLPTPRTFKDIKKDPWLSVLYVEWEIRWILCGKYLLKMLKCLTSDILSDGFLCFDYGWF